MIKNSEYRLIFWQNIISSHQVDFLQELDKKMDVSLYVEERMSTFRAKDGWSIPDTTIDVSLISEELIVNSFKDLDVVHVFSGIGSYQKVHQAFKTAVKNKAKIILLTEPYDLKGWKGKIRLIRGQLFRLMYGSKLKHIFAIGEDGISCFRRLGYNKDQLTQWGYYVNPTDHKNVVRGNNLIFVGQLNNRKQILRFLEFYVEHKGFGFDKFYILGKGPDLEAIQALAKESNLDICVKGRLSSMETTKLIADSKLLVLPSLVDGWGVVVNEALMQGTPVFVSNNVGAKSIIEEDSGYVLQDVYSSEAIKILKNVALSSLEADYFEDIRNVATEVILPKVKAKEFIEIIESV